MATWKSRNQDLINASNQNKIISNGNKLLSDRVAKAQEFIKAHRQLEPRAKQFDEKVTEAEAKLNKIIATASEHQEKLDKAKKSKAKQEAKDLEKELKDLEKDWKKTWAEYIANQAKRDEQRDLVHQASEKITADGSKT